MKCKVCDRTIKGNAGNEHYNATTQLNEYTCRACCKKFTYVSTRQYELSHGKAPRGRGYWAFFFDDKTDIDDAYWVRDASYSDALKLAQRHAAYKGYSKIEVGS